MPKLQYSSVLYYSCFSCDWWKTWPSITLQNTQDNETSENIYLTMRHFYQMMNNCCYRSFTTIHYCQTYSEALHNSSTDYQNYFPARNIQSGNETFDKNVYQSMTKLQNIVSFSHKIPYTYCRCTETIQKHYISITFVKY